MLRSSMPPNVLLIVADSLPAAFTGPYGDESGATPNLHRMAAAGVTFDDVSCSYPLCAPSRASFLTGRYASRLGCFDNGSPFGEEWPTIAHALGALGYESTIVGKMHFVGHDQHHGFDRRLALETDYSKRYEPRLFGLAYDWDQPSAGNPDGVRMMGASYVEADEWRHYPLHFDRDEAIHDAALAYLAEATEPFLACVSYHAPHNPFWIPSELRERFRGARLNLPATGPDPALVHGPMDAWLNDFHYVPRYRDAVVTRENLTWLYETFYGMVLDLDRRVGELLDAVASRDTLVVFVSDHGDMMGERGMIQKRYFYEKSVRVPMIVSWPGRVAGGRRLREPVSLVDLFPTVAEATGAPVPADLDGVSLLPSLLGAGAPPARDLFAEYHGEGVHAPCFMLRRGRWKYVYVHGFEERLYDLEDDPLETRNAIGDPALDPLVGDLRASLRSAFDPDEVARRARASQRARRFVFDADRLRRAADDRARPAPPP